MHSGQCPDGWMLSWRQCPAYFSMSLFPLAAGHVRVCPCAQAEYQVISCAYPILHLLWFGPMQHDC